MTEALLVGRLENVTPYGMAPSKPSPLKLAPAWRTSKLYQHRGEARQTLVRLKTLCPLRRAIRPLVKKIIRLYMR
jgi:hypothetical protein